MESISEKEKTLVDIDLEEVIVLIKKLLIPIVESIRTDTDYSCAWDFEKHSWK